MGILTDSLSPTEQRTTYALYGEPSHPHLDPYLLHVRDGEKGRKMRRRREGERKKKNEVKEGRREIWTEEEEKEGKKCGWKGKK